MDSICEKKRLHLSRARTIIVKVGSAVLTDAEGLKNGVINSLAAQLAHLSRSAKDPIKIVLVSSGAVAAGKSAIRLSGKPGLPWQNRFKPALAAIGQTLLMQAWNEAFAPWNILTAQVLLTREDLRSRPRFQTAAGTFADILSWGVLPIVNENDVVSSSGPKFGDNDFLASLLVNLVEADLFVNLTSAPGVFDSSPVDNPQARIMPVIEDISTLHLESLCGPKTEAGSGGMRSKLLAARRIAALGVPTLILPGKMDNVLLKAFGLNQPMEDVGTWIPANEKSIPRRKFWLAYQSEPAGEVEIDDGAVQALLYEGRSLLPGGITRVEGKFEKGALIRVAHQGENLGVGFSNYNSDELAKICGLKRHEVAAILGKARYPDVIHRDNLLLDAAI